MDFEPISAGQQTRPGSGPAALEPKAVVCVCVSMARNLQELSEREQAEEAEALLLPTAEFVPLFAAAAVLLGLVFGIVMPSVPIL